ncbi:unnamed protein product [Spodoptera exigua]|nr:unnamed protein product [Spodoptera exigua]
MDKLDHLLIRSTAHHRQEAMGKVHKVLALNKVLVTFKVVHLTHNTVLQDVVMAKDQMEGAQVDEEALVALTVAEADLNRHTVHPEHRVDPTVEGQASVKDPTVPMVPRQLEISNLQPMVSQATSGKDLKVGPTLAICRLALGLKVLPVLVGSTATAVNHHHHMVCPALVAVLVVLEVLAEEAMVVDLTMMMDNLIYEVDDAQTGTKFGHSEQRDGDLATGEYNVVLPDGRRQVVEYEAGLQGYMPQIRYEGWFFVLEAQEGKAGLKVGVKATHKVVPVAISLVVTMDIQVQGKISQEVLGVTKKAVLVRATQEAKDLWATLVGDQVEMDGMEMAEDLAKEANQVLSSHQVQGMDIPVVVLKVVVVSQVVLREVTAVSQVVLREVTVVIPVVVLREVTLVIPVVVQEEIVEDSLEVMETTAMVIQVDLKGAEVDLVARTVVEDVVDLKMVEMEKKATQAVDRVDHEDLDIKNVTTILFNDRNKTLQR